MKSGVRWLYRSVVLISRCPNSSFTPHRLAPARTRWVAAVCRRLCHDAPTIPALRRLGSKCLLTKLRASKGFSGSLPGNTNALRVKLSHPESQAQAPADNGTYRLFDPFGMGRARTRFSRSTCCHFNLNCSDRRRPVSIAKATICQSSGFIRSRSFRISSSHRNRVFLLSGKDLYAAHGLPIDHAVFDGQHEYVPQK